VRVGLDHFSEVVLRAVEGEIGGGEGSFGVKSSPEGLLVAEDGRTGSEGEKEWWRWRECGESVKIARKAVEKEELEEGLSEKGACQFLLHT
jgi:hypothetical protein